MTDFEKLVDNAFAYIIVMLVLCLCAFSLGLLLGSL
jgi:hypothetical protein